MTALRCFVGLRPAPDLVDGLCLASAAVRSVDRGWADEKWVPSENLHVTVKFLGDVDESALPRLTQALSAAVAGVDAFGLELSGLRAVPSTRRCRMIWAEFLDPDAGAQRLFCAVEAAGVDIGVPPDERTFAPHATLCRARRPRPLAPEAVAAADSAIPAGNRMMSVPLATLWSSRLTPRGPIYREIGSWPLRGE